MAKKDWKIGASYVQSDGTVTMLWYKKRNPKSGIMVESDRRNSFYVVTTGEVAENYFGNFRTWGRAKDFKTRNQAIKYAEAYMKKHG